MRACVRNLPRLDDPDSGSKGLRQAPAKRETLRKKNRGALRRAGYHGVGRQGKKKNHNH